jgi:hypothetical protein
MSGYKKIAVVKERCETGKAEGINQGERRELSVSPTLCNVCGQYQWQILIRRSGHVEGHRMSSVYFLPTKKLNSIS